MTYQNNIRIYSFYYKNTIIPIANGIYFPVMAGNTFIQNQRMTGDDSGESISEKTNITANLPEFTGFGRIQNRISQVPAITAVILL
jgi:hypothetical protein